MLRRFTLLLPFICILFSATAYAGIHGILKGKVVDEEGKPLIGAAVLVQGVGRGANTKKDGTFQIMNISAGSYDIRVTYTGFDPQIKRITISADNTTNVTIVMKVKVTDGATVEIVANKMVSKNDIGGGTKMDTKELTSAASGGINGFVGLAANVSVGNGFEIRGARAGDSQVRVDGLDVGNQFTGGFGGGSARYYPQVSAFATEEVQILSGGFGAEYGEATGGIVNSVVKTGRTDRYEGFLYYNTDMPALFGSSKSGIVLERQGSVLNAVETGEGKKLQGRLENNFEYGFGGPLPGSEKSTFYLTGVNSTEQFRNASYEVLDPLGNNVGQLDNTSSWKRQLTARMKFAVTDEIDITVGTQYGFTTLENGSWAWLYSTQTGKTVDALGNITDNGVPENIAKQNVLNQYVYNFFGKINHRLDESSFYELKFSFSANNDELGRRVVGSKPGFTSGYEMMTPVDVVSPGKNGVSDKESDQTIDFYSLYPGENVVTNDGATFRNSPLRNPLTGYYEGQQNVTGTQNAYGLQNFFVTHGADGGFDFRYGSYFQADGFYQRLMKDGDFSHDLKTGFEFRSYTQHRNLNQNPYQANNIHDVYTDKFGGNLYDVQTQEVIDLTSKPKTPTRGSVWVQDQITAKGVVFTPGLRLDYFNPNSAYRSVKDEFVPISDQSKFKQADAKIMFSPRLNVTYPVTEESNLIINYGIYYKMPVLQSLYDGSNTDFLQPGTLIGDPNLSPEKTIMYNLTYNNQLTNDFAFNMSVYYNDIFNQLGVVYVAAVPTPFFRNVVSEYGSNKGIELEFRKVDRDYLGFRLNYTLGYINGTSNAAASNINVLTDPYTNTKAFPLAEYSLGRDVRHRIKYILNFFINDDGSSESRDFQGRTSINFSGAYSTGAPYTKTAPGGGVELGERNSERFPSNFTSNIRFTRTFPLKDFFGEDMKNSSIDLFIDVFNWLNIRQVLTVYGATGKPLDDGVFLNRQVGNFTETALYKEANLARPETVAAGQYDSFGNRLYSVQSDFDNNGVVNQEEKFKSYVNYVQDALNFRNNFQTPRTVYLGVVFKF